MLMLAAGRHPRLSRPLVARGRFGSDDRLGMQNRHDGVVLTGSAPADPTSPGSKPEGVDRRTEKRRSRRASVGGTGMGLEFGVFDHLDRNDLPLREYYEQRLKVIEALDRSGFYAYHVAEHHFTPLGMAPSPSVFLSAIAQRTTRLRFGTFVYALPVHHPLRVLEEICMLDHLSGGRLEIGFGRGSVPFEISYYGQNAEERQEIYAERLELILKAFTVKTLTWN